MKVTRILAAVALVAGFAGAAHAQNGCARLSWGTANCATWVENQNYGAAGPYALTLAMQNVSAPNVGTDSQIRIRHLNEPGGTQAPVPDSWRFDDSGCQTGSQLTLNNNGSKTCPSMKGANSLAITQYATDVDGSAFLRLAITYDTFTPSAATKYTVWNVIFDHTFSNIGPTPADNSTCGGADLCENLSLDFAEVLAQTGQGLFLPGCDSDPLKPGTLATWNGGCEPPVAAVPTTWGKL